MNPSSKLKSNFFWITLVAALALVFAWSCSSLGSSSSLVRTSASQALTANHLRLRWFPVDEAEGYKLSVMGDKGRLLELKVDAPRGCTHKLKQGYTAGICFLDVELPQNAKVRSIELNAYNAKGQSLAAVAPITR